jgi:restriction endonuclease Mrr
MAALKIVNTGKTRRNTLAVPEFQSFFLPLLQYSSDGKLHSTKEAHDAMVDHFRLSQEDQQEKLPSGKQATYKNRVAWARVYLSKALLLEAPKRGFFRITERGQELLKSNPAELRVKHLKQYPEFVEFHKTGNKQKFVGALHGQRAKKGVFITTGAFTRDAEQYVSTIDPKVALIDGSRLVELMIDHSLGVSPVDAYEIKKIDSDFFFEE